MSERASRAARRRIGGVAWQIGLAGLAALFVVPLCWVLSASLRPLGRPPPNGIEWLPPAPAWSNYGRIFQLVPLGRYLLNSLIVAGLALPLTLLTASLAGFALSQLRPRPRRRLAALTLGLLMVPGTALWLPRYLLFKQLGLLDTVWALVAPAIMGSSPLFVLLFYWTFRALPAELFEAARLDGASPLWCWSRIALPLARPTAFAVGVLTFMLYWSDFLSPLLYLKSERRYTLAVGLRTLQQMDQTNWPLLMAAAVVMTAPVILLFLLIQRFFWPPADAKEHP